MGIKIVLIGVALGLLISGLTALLADGLFKDFVRHWTRKPPDVDYRAVNPFWAIIAFYVFYIGFAVIWVSIFDVPSQTSTGLGELRANYPWLMFVAFVTRATVVEELVFRGVPLFFGWIIAKIFRKDWGFWLGLLSSLMFGIGHITNYSDLSFTQMLIVVIPKIFLGLQFWYIAKKYGFHWAIVAHVAYDAILFVPY